MSGVPVLSNLKDRTRRLVPFAFGACALRLRWLPRWGAVSMAAAALFYNTVLGPKLGLDRGYRRPGEGFCDGLATYPLAVLLLVAFLSPVVAAGAWVVLAVADPVAAAVGSLCPRPAVPFNPRKSLVGAVGGFGAGALACCGILVFMGVARPWAPGVAAAGAGAVAEILPLRIDDNLVIAAAAGGALLAFGL